MTKTAAVLHDAYLIMDQMDKLNEITTTYKFALRYDSNEIRKHIPTVTQQNVGIEKSTDSIAGRKRNVLGDLIENDPNVTRNNDPNEIIDLSDDEEERLSWLQEQNDEIEKENQPP